MFVKLGHSYSVRNSGFTMVELMVAILVLAIGLLGLASLQVWGLSGNHNAYLRTQGTMLAQDIAERIRSNLKGDYLMGGDTCKEYAASKKDCGISSCSNAEMAEYDLTKWCANVTSKLPDGDAKLSQSPDGSIYNIEVSWKEQETDPKNPKVKKQVSKSFSTSFQP